MSSPTPVIPEGIVTLQGRFARISVPDVMGFLQMIGISGALEIEAIEGVVQIFWVDGELVSSRALRGGARIGDLMVRRGRMRPDDVEIAWREAKKLGILLGEAIVRLGFASRESVDAILVEQAFDNIYRLFSWTPTAFRFIEGAAAPAQGALFRADVANVLLEGARRCDEWGRLPTAFADPDALFEVIPEPEGAESIQLSLDEWKLLYLVNGRRRLKEVWRKSPFASDLETSRALYGIASAKLIRPASRESVAAAAEEPKPVRSVPVGESSSIRLREAAPEQESVDALGTRAMTKVGATASAAIPAPALPNPAADEDPEESTHVLPPASVETLQRDEVRVSSRASLVSVDDAAEAKAFDLETDVVTMGRGFDNHLVLADGHVSGHHAVITRRGNGYFIEDSGSHNGFLVNGKKVARALLANGDEIEIYPYRFRFELRFDVSESSTKKRPTVRLPRSIPAS